uniref:Ig-like domain-containing protein n=1 Tax=Neogobius melanostomus TaxID=47308 RepID=A0A8C6SS62_9GOBI
MLQQGRFIEIFIAFCLTSGAGVLPENSVNAAVGGSVTFTTSLTPTGTPLDSITWNRDTRLIVNSVAGGVSITPEYKDRVTLDVLTGSLELRNLAVSDNGKYDVTIIPTAGDESITGQATLKVYEPVTNVRITANNTALVEFNDTVRLSCSASGSSLSFLWFNDSVEVTASDRVRITESVESATLTIVTVLRYDQGLYTCNVSNPVSSSNSSDEELSVSYGPESSVVSFSCSADSRPEAQFRWFINGDMLSSTEAQINLVMEQSGNYSCQAFNSKTLRYTTSPSAEIFVLSKNTSAARLSLCQRLNTPGQRMERLWFNHMNTLKTISYLQTVESTSAELQMTLQRNHQRRHALWM